MSVYICAEKGNIWINIVINRIFNVVWKGGGNIKKNTTKSVVNNTIRFEKYRGESINH